MRAVSSLESNIVQPQALNIHPQLMPVIEEPMLKLLVFLDVS